MINSRYHTQFHLKIDIKIHSFKYFRSKLMYFIYLPSLVSYLTKVYKVPSEVSNFQSIRLYLDKFQYLSRKSLEFQLYLEKLLFSNNRD